MVAAVRWFMINGIRDGVTIDQWWQPTCVAKKLTDEVVLYFFNTGDFGEQLLWKPLT